MKFTNKYNLPEMFTNWIKTDEYDYEPGVITATSLLSPARAFALRKNNYDKLEVDLSNIISSRMGTIIHDSLFECIKIDETRGDFKEKRFYTEVNGQKISGKIDLLFDNTIKDYKNTSVYKYIEKDFDDYIKQLSIYRYILVKNGYKPNDFGCIFFLFTNWSKKDLDKPNYPPSRIFEQKIDLMSIEETEKFIIERLNAFKDAIDNLPLCTKDELWETDPTYAVMKSLEAARAIRVFNKKDDAEFFNSDGKNIVIERKGTAKRCEYCSVHNICEQCQKLIAEGRAANLYPNCD